MPRPRFHLSIGGSLSAIALIGVTLAALMSPSHLWGNAFYTLTAFVLVLAVLKAVYSRGEHRAFAVGFAACGWAFFLSHYGPEPLANVAGNLVSRPICDLIYPYTVPASAGAVTPPAQAVVSMPTTTPTLSFTTANPPTTPGGVGTYTFTSVVVNTTSTSTAWEDWTRPDRTTTAEQFSPGYFRRVLLNVICLMVAALGGTLTRHFYRTRDEPGDDPA